MAETPTTVYVVLTDYMDPETGEHHEEIEGVYLDAETADEAAGAAAGPFTRSEMRAYPTGGGGQYQTHAEYGDAEYQRRRRLANPGELPPAAD